MNKVEIEDKVYIDINGKTFKLLRGFEDDDRSYMPFAPKLLQVTGKFTLMREDLPNKDWRMIKSNVNGVTVYTIFDKKYAMFESESKTKRIIFFGASYEGAMILAFTYLVHHYSLDYEPEKIEDIAIFYAKEDNRRMQGIQRLTDKGNGEIDAVMVRFTTDGYSGFNDDPDELVEIIEGR